MDVTRLPHYLKKVWELGPRNSFHVVKNRMESAWHERRLRQRARSGAASHSWKEITEKHGIKEFFSSFWQQQKKKSLSFIDQLYVLQSNEVKQQADLFEQKTFDLLGSGPISFQTIPWHSDFRLYAQDKTADHLFDKHAFYKDIHVSPGATERLVKDIKVPWELSRFQHLFVLGQAYKFTGDARYVHSFVEQVEDWMQENPYLLGANWVCPMDVGIRALNWICAFHFFKDAEISEDFWQRFFCSLYDHFVYLENNWEIYDGRTSNHYLSDLVGYFYLCYFFDSLSGIDHKMVKCQQSIIQELHKQVGDDGADYEGSTNYHVLVTEIFFHAQRIAQEAGMPFSSEYDEKLNRMVSFAAYTKDLQIGDNDSGKILYYGLPSSIQNNVVKEGEIVAFANFGLSCLKFNRWTLSLRHHAYSKIQPSGHFHNDIGSIMIAVDEKPLIVDPGSYLYTPSAYWRNYFRSAEQHNTFYLEGREPVLLDERLFALDIPEEKNLVSHGRLATSHTLYADAIAHREVVYSENKVEIADSWQGGVGKSYATVWNFMLAPEINVEKVEATLVLVRQEKKIARITSDLTLGIEESWFSAEYGSKTSCKKIRARELISSGQKIKTVLELI